MNKRLIRSYITNIIQTLNKSLFPPVCFGCGGEGALLCYECHKLLDPYPEICPLCKKYQQYGKVCNNCFKQTYLSGVFVAFNYTGAIKKAIRALKYTHTKQAVDILSKKIALLLQTVPIGEKKRIIITSVPIHRWKLHMIRGYNQSELLAKEVAKILGHIYLPLFSKKHRTRSQTRFSRSKRMSNIAGSFCFKDTSLINKKSIIIIIDDVVTTGTTLNELASLVKKDSKGQLVYGAVIARNG